MKQKKKNKKWNKTKRKWMPYYECLLSAIAPYNANEYNKFVLIKLLMKTRFQHIIIRFCLSLLACLLLKSNSPINSDEKVGVCLYLECALHILNVHFLSIFFCGIFFFSLNFLNLLSPLPLVTQFNGNSNSMYFFYTCTQWCLRSSLSRLFLVLIKAKLHEVDSIHDFEHVWAAERYRICIVITFQTRIK